MANRVVVVVDGFNLYHSLRTASRQRVNPVACRWLDLHAMFSARVRSLGRDATLAGIYYYSALAAHKEATHPGTMARHDAYAQALRATGVYAEFARFQEKDMLCPSCKQPYIAHEEKQTDVAVGIRILESALTGAAETIVVVSADSDLIPALQRTRMLFPSVKLYAAFPAFRGSEHIRRVVDCVWKLRMQEYARFQFPDPVTLPNGQTVAKPAGW